MTVAAVWNQCCYAESYLLMNREMWKKGCCHPVSGGRNLGRDDVFFLQTCKVLIFPTFSSVGCVLALVKWIPAEKSAELGAGGGEQQEQKGWTSGLALPSEAIPLILLQVAAPGWCKWGFPCSLSVSSIGRDLEVNCFTVGSFVCEKGWNLFHEILTFADKWCPAACAKFPFFTCNPCYKHLLPWYF